MIIVVAIERAIRPGNFTRYDEERWIEIYCGWKHTKSEGYLFRSSTVHRVHWLSIVRTKDS